MALPAIVYSIIFTLFTISHVLATALPYWVTNGRFNQGLFQICYRGSCTSITPLG